MPKKIAVTKHSSAAPRSSTLSSSKPKKAAPSKILTRVKPAPPARKPKSKANPKKAAIVVEVDDTPAQEASPEAEHDVETVDESDTGAQIAQQLENEDGDVSVPASDPEENENMIPLEIPKLDKKTLMKGRQKSVTADDSNASHVVYLGRVPYGFFEPQMRGFFSQFGEVQRLRLSRNKKTGKSKHYAFIQFKHSETARIVAESMNGYLLFGHRLMCRLVPTEKQHPSLWKGANSKFKTIPWKKINKAKHNQAKEPEQVQKTIQKLLQKESKKRTRLAELGINYNFPGYAADTQAQPKHKKFKL